MIIKKLTIIIFIEKYSERSWKAEVAVMFVTAEIVAVGVVLIASFLQLNKMDKNCTAKSTG